MHRLTILCSAAILTVFLTIGSTSSGQEASVISDKFELELSFDGEVLLLRIDTDLPDFAQVILSVDRNFFEVGDTDTAYVWEYFSERSRVENWRTTRRIPLNNEAWKQGLQERQESLARISRDAAFEIGQIEDTVSVRAVIHANQENPQFGGRGNPRLSGAAVSKSGNWNIIEVEHQVSFPLTGEPMVRQAMSVAYDGLEVGETYCLRSETPIMAYDPESASQAIEQQGARALEGSMLLVPSSTSITVIDVDTDAGIYPWYRVLLSVDGTNIVGFINSTALIREGVIRCD